jgi:arylsulfatase A-like enzyme
MPTLAALAEQGVTFDRAFSPSNVTRRSIPSMILGLAPPRVRGRVVGWALRLDPRHLMLAERLRAGGYDTAGFMCCSGFWDPAVRTGLQRGLDHLEIEPHGKQLATMAATWLQSREEHPGNPPLFMWMHILEPHNWTAITGEPHDEAQRTQFYDRVLGDCDGMLATVMAAFASRPVASRPIVIVTADHGEALGEHGHAYHSTDLYDSQTHVPLVIAGPGIKPGRIRETVSLIGLTPAIVELAGFVAPSGPAIDGRSFADLATGTRASDDNGGLAFAAMIKDRSNPGGVVMIVSGHWKLINNHHEEELYDIEADPDEKHDLAATHPDELARLRALLADKLTRAESSPFSAP